MGVGFMVCDHRGIIVLAAGFSLSKCSVPLVEFYGAGEGILVAVKLPNAKDI